jgi:NAD(P)H dehydrogenase (quinone)
LGGQKVLILACPGSPWGAGTFSGDGSRFPSALELEIANIQGKTFYEHVAKFKF